MGELYNNPHDLRRQVSYLQQVLSHDKKPLSLFLGAGCPMSIPHPSQEESRLIPDIKGLTAHIISRFEEHTCGEAFSKLHNHFREDGIEHPNVEQILSHLRSLRQVCGSSEVRGLSSHDLDKLEEAICEEICKVMTQGLPHNGTPYHNMAAWMSRQRETAVEIFTTNYDLLIEQALEETGIPYFDGFVGAREPFFDTHAVEADALPSRWARVWKLHGSINWYLSKSGVIRGSFSSKGERRVIHPSHLKYDESRRMPYLALLDRLKSFFKKPSAALITCGYSFRDQHINEIIIQGLQGNPTAMCFALLHSCLEQYQVAMRGPLGPALKK